MLNIVRHEIEVGCLPKFLPGALKLDVSELGMDDAIRVADLPKLEGVEYRLDERRVIAVVHAPDNKGDIDEEDEESAEA